MTVTTGNFQDLVQLSIDTLYHQGPMYEVGNSAASTVTVGFSNSAGELHLAASQTAAETLWLPLGTVGTLLSNINISAGTTSNNLSAVTFSNSNNVTFGLNGSVITASVNADALAIGAIQAGTQTATSGTVVFSNSNNVTFGMSNSSVVTASVTVASTQASINLSAGTTSNLASAFTFSNSNGVSFGLNGSTITASINPGQASINFSGGTTSNNLSAITFSNSNGVSFGLNGSTMTASVATSLTNINVSAGTTSNNLSAITFSNSNNVSFGLNGSTVTASVTVASTQASINLSAGTTSNLASAFTFSNSNGISFGLNASTVTASVATSLTNINVSAGTTSNNLSALVFSNSNGFSFGLNGSTVTMQNGGISSWSNGYFATAQTMGQGTLFFQPIIVPYAITVTNLLWLASVSSQASNSSGGLSVSAALYTLSGGTKITLVSSGSTNLTWTSGAALSSNTGINYQQMSLNSWALTPGPYLFGWWVSTENGIGLSIYGNVQQPAISSGKVAAMSNLMVNGYSQATTNALPASFGLSNTASYIRTGATAAQQPTFIFQGT